MEKSSDKIGLMEVNPGAFLTKEKPKEIKFEAPANDFDPTKELKDLVNEFKSGTSTDAALDIVKELENTIIPDNFLPNIGREEKLLQKAKANIAKKLFSEALISLNELLQINKDHHEAIYWKALCYINQKKELEALEILKYFSVNKPHSDLQNLITSLIGKIRSQVIIQIMFLSLLNKNENLTRKLDALIELDDGYEPYYFIQSMIYARQKMLNEALSSVEKGLIKIPGDKALRLKNMKNILERQLLEKEMINAIKFIKMGKYKIAEASLNSIDKRLHKTRLFILIWNYTLKLDKESGFFRKKTPLEVPIDGTVADRYLVQSEIVKDEIDNAVPLIRRKLYNQALPYLDQAELYVYRYPFLHYLRAYCVYHQYLIDFLSLKFSNNIEKAIDELEMIKHDAEIAQEDFTIIDAKPLLNQINLMFVLMDGPRQAQLMRKEVEKVNTLIKAFTAIMEEGKAIRDMAHLKKIRIELQRIKRESEQELNRIKSKEGEKYLNQIIQATTRNLDGLIDIEKDFENQERDKKIIVKQSNLYKNYVDDINKGRIKIKSRWDLDSYIDNINKYINNIKKYEMQRVKSQVGKKTLNQIISNWESLKQQFVDLKYKNY
jgi:hypothetical protein